MIVDTNEKPINNSNKIRIKLLSPIISNDKHALDLSISISDDKLSASDYEPLQMECPGQYLQYLIKKNHITDVYDKLSDKIKEQYSYEAFKKIVTRLWRSTARGRNIINDNEQNGKKKHIEGKIGNIYLLQELLSIVGVTFEDLMNVRQYKNDSSNMLRKIKQRLDSIEKKIDSTNKRNNTRFGNITNNEKYLLFYVLLKVGKITIDNDIPATANEGLYNNYYEYVELISSLSIQYEILQRKLNYFPFSSDKGKDLEISTYDLSNEMEKICSVTDRIDDVYSQNIRRLVENINSLVYLLRQALNFSPEKKNFEILTNGNNLLFCIMHLQNALQLKCINTEGVRTSYVFSIGSLIFKEVNNIRNKSCELTEHSTYFSILCSFRDQIKKDVYLDGFIKAASGDSLDYHLKHYLMPMYCTYLLVLYCMRFIQCFDGTVESNCFYEENRGLPSDDRTEYNHLIFSRTDIIPVNEDYLQFKEKCIKILKCTRSFAKYCIDLPLKKIEAKFDISLTQSLYSQILDLMLSVFDAGSYANLIIPTKVENEKTRVKKNEAFQNTRKSDVSKYFEVNYGIDIKFKLTQEKMNEFDNIVLRCLDIYHLLRRQIVE